MKILKRIKWENIFFILSICFGIQAMIHHIKLNGLYIELSLEVIMYAFMSLGIKNVVCYVRKHPKQVLTTFKQCLID